MSMHVGKFKSGNRVIEIFWKRIFSDIVQKILDFISLRS